MRVTRGDNIAFLFLPALTILGIAGTFVAGKIYTTLNPIVISVSNRTGETISDLTVTCSGESKKNSLKSNGVSQFEFSTCEGRVSIGNGSFHFGSCTPDEVGFSRLDVDIKAQILIDGDCRFTE